MTGRQATLQTPKRSRTEEAGRELLLSGELVKGTEPESGRLSVEERAPWRSCFEKKGRMI